MDAPLTFARLLRALFVRLRDRRGNVMILFAVALIPLTFATGMGIDYSAAMRLRTKLDAAADSAVLAATTTPMLNQTVVAACAAATAMFNLQSRNLAGLTLDTSTPAGLKITMTESYTSSSSPTTMTCGALSSATQSSSTTPVSRTATLTYRGTSANSFAGILGVPTLTVAGASTAQVGLASYFQIVFAVDVSNSMAIGGTSSDITSLQNDKQIQCAFACHDPNGTDGHHANITASTWCEGHPDDTNCRNSPTYCPYGAGQCGNNISPSKTYADLRGLARAFKYKLKIDYINDAITSFINALQPSMQKAPNNFSVSVYTFGTGDVSGSNDRSGTGLFLPALQSSTTDWSTLKSGSGKIDIETAARSPSGYGNQGWTYTSNALRNLRNNLSNVGDGSSPTARKTYIIFMSDGVEDTFDASNALGQYNRATGYAYSQQCKAAKDAGLTVFSIETSYPVVNNDGQYDALVRNLPSRNSGVQIADVMKGCASSPDKYFLASDGPGIQSAVSNVFAAISAEASRLTQ